MTRRLYKLYVCLFALALLASAGSAQAQKPWLHVDGNQIKDPAGNPVTLRGVSVLPSEHHNECTTCNNKPMSEMIAWQADGSRGWYSRVLRLPVTTAKVKDPATSFATHIDPYVQQAIALNQYVIVDLHLVSNYDVNGSGGVKQQFVMDFWKYVAPRYANTPNVIFEIFNEPVNPDNWTSWKNYIQPVIDSIRAVAPNNLILVGSPQWSTRVNSAVTSPLTGGNLVYVYHIYPNQGAASAANLNAKFGNAANTIPVMLTEFGWNQDPNYSDGVTFGTTGGWGTPFRNYIDAHPWISWQGWIFDNFWKPQYFDWNWNLMSGENQGRFMQNWLFELQNHNQPGGAGGIGTQTPYAAHTIPGRIQTEDFDIGAQDVAYHDTDLGNNGNTYRSTDVDLGTTTDVGGGYVVGYTVNGEWLEYTVGSVAAGNYTIGIRSASASGNAGKLITVKLDGVTLGTVIPNNTGAWETWETLSLNNISIAGGSNKVLRLEISGGSFNLNYIEFTPAGQVSTVYEAETTSRWSSGASNTVVAQAQASGGNLVRVSADGAGDFVEYTYTHSGVKNYDVYLGFRAGPDQGTCQVYKDGAAYGPVFDLYSPTTVYKEVMVANLTFYTGQQKVRFTVAGKNAASTGYQFTHDYVKLVDHATTLGAASALRVSGASAIQVYPNPATTTLTVKGVPEGAEVTIRDATGNLRLSQKSAVGETAIDIQRLRPGLHILRVVFGGEIFTYTFLKE
ncbi:cellulase family glycosylhydrolase [Dawidia soli]|uniref:Cellulase family glycosylhydrolase n=1 Tax=Dawidia soli TaxID=2782352 RepID=A0AAP2DHB5_9BACT|nr:cellulase family glycosylhydrolase [Dawidia soli]MBT1690685.1 cellulase family glycosylhydrolase [Dawidia soli]